MPRKVTLLQMAPTVDSSMPFSVAIAINVKSSIIPDNRFIPCSYHDYWQTESLDGRARNGLGRARVQPRLN